VFVVEITKYLKTPTEELRKRHLDYLTECEKQGKLLLAGRFHDAEGAMIIWLTSSLEEAKALAEKDPYARENCISYTLREWHITIGRITQSH
jgi:Uncharacterized protein conserved in bacteria